MTTKTHAKAMLVRALVAPFLALALGGCSSAYWLDRASDLTDAAHVELNAASAGVAANAGPAVLGFYGIGGACTGSRVQLGLGGVREVWSNGIESGVLVPFSHIEDEPFWKWDHAPRQPYYGKEAPAWGSVGLDFGFVFGFGARVDFVELCDFFAGWVGFDLVDDDYHAMERRAEDDRTSGAAAPADGGSKSRERSAPVPGNAPVEEKPR